MEVASVVPPVTTAEVGFRLGPRLNAAGRLNTAEAALKLLLTGDPADAQGTPLEFTSACNGAIPEVQSGAVADVGPDLVVAIEDVGKAYGRRVIYEGLNLTIRRGERWCVMGQNGSGKTTLLKMIAGHLQPDGGMLKLGSVTANDVHYDLGSGDGRIVVTAAQRFGIAGLGIEIDPLLVATAQAHARRAGVSHLARFAAQDLFDTDLSPATVITLYLLPKVNLMLRPRLLRLKPGTRIVSHDWDMGEWPPDRSIEVDAPNKPVGLNKSSRLMLWTVRGDEPAAWRT
jgi:energy-coupling factor transporter ATP-binding protein EcfA2